MQSRKELYELLHYTPGKEWHYPESEKKWLIEQVWDLYRLNGIIIEACDFNEKKYRRFRRIRSLSSLILSLMSSPEFLKINCDITSINSSVIDYCH
jgi:hypothetical protein